MIIDSANAASFKSNDLLGSGRETSHRNRCQYRDLRDWLRDRDVADMANLAVLLAASVRMPMAGGVNGQGAHTENQGHRQHTH